MCEQEAETTGKCIVQLSSADVWPPDSDMRILYTRVCKPDTGWPEAGWYGHCSALRNAVVEYLLLHNRCAQCMLCMYEFRDDLSSGHKYYMRATTDKNSAFAFESLKADHT